MKNLPATVEQQPLCDLDLGAMLSSVRLAVLFLKSKAVTFDLAYGVASKAAIFRQVVTGSGRIAYVAGFGDGEDQARRALMLMDYAQNWKGTTVFIQGRPAGSSWRIRDTLHCYIKSFLHDPPSAYCTTVERIGGMIVVPMMTIQMRVPGEIPVQPPLPPPQPALVLPCRRLSHYRWHSVLHGPLLRDQMIGDAIEREVIWCARFDPDKFKETEIPATE